MLTIPKIPKQMDPGLKSQPSEEPKKYTLPGDDGRNVGVAKAKIEKAPTLLKGRAGIAGAVTEGMSSGKLAKVLSMMKRKKKMEGGIFAKPEGPHVLQNRDAKKADKIDGAENVDRESGEKDLIDMQID